MILLCLFVLCIIGSDQAVGERQAPECSQNGDQQSSTATSYSSSSTSSSHSSSSSYSASSISSSGCNDDTRCRNDQNAVFKKCPNPCPRTCQYPGGTGPCSKLCLKEGCECKDGYYLSDNGKCVQLQDCPGARKCSANETFAFCSVGCPNNYCPVDDSRAIIACSPPFPCGSGCTCKGDYLRLSHDDDRCILAYECPEVICSRPNEVWNGCPPPCLNDRCADVGKPAECDTRFYSCRPQCVCKPGFLRNDDDICVPEKECPLSCGYNEMPVKCKTVCPPQSCDISYTDYACGNTTVCEPGCDCIQNHLRNASGICIYNEDCPPPLSCGYNEMPVKCKTVCPPQSCDISYTDYACGNTTVCEPGCDCIQNHLRNASGICIYNEDCPPPLSCGYNEMPVKCKTVCPPQSCDISYTDYACGNTTVCEPGCDCIQNHLRNASGICIYNEDCPPPLSCGYNEMPVKCKTVCPPQSCDISYTDYACGNTTVCEPGCDCIQNCLRNASGICIYNEDCPPPPVIPTCRSDLNEELSSCKIVCPPQTCESIYTLYLCVADIPCELGCNCLKGYLRNSSGICVPSIQCPRNPPLICSYNEKPSDCRVICPPQTCESIFTTYPCEKNYVCEPGCDCLDQYLRNASGICVPSDECFLAGNPCGVNGTFVDCAFRCPNQNCPEDDSGLVVACKPGRPCPSGCLCKEYYRRTSATDDTCVMASDCPTVDCTRQNEVWNPCASECLAETCADIGREIDCFPDPKNCQPKCVCSDGFYRNNSGYCVSKKECEPLCQVQQDCRPTCAVPNPPGCSFIPPSDTNDDNCNCEKGYILSARGGTCIKIEECPIGIGCNNDPHARIRECPIPCPSTCDAPNATPCKRQCDPIGCECEPGYILNNGQCILPDDCKGGNPCGPNSTFVQCKYNCPSFYCPIDDSRAVAVCETFPFAPCFSGCVCKLNHRMLSRENPICIRSDECPAVNCTRPHEEWNPCPIECFSGYCEEVDNPPTTCNTLVFNCNPQCQCTKTFFRNPKTDICVTSDECRKINKENSK